MTNDKIKKARELIIYIIFGALTTAVSFLTYFMTLWIGESLLSLSPKESEFFYVRAVAEVLQWVFGVLFAFFTNKKWVFTDADSSLKTSRQLSLFACSRLLTLLLDAALTFGAVFLLQSLNYSEPTLNFLISITLSADLVAKLFSAVAVVIANYFISKFIVFRSKR